MFSTEIQRQTIMHYALCIVNYALCIMHYALCIVN